MRFEDAGRALDRELEKLREFLDQKVKPPTRQETANFLRKTAEHMKRLAESLEKEEDSKAGSS